MNVLVTGVASPLGEAVCRQLRLRGAEITGTIRPGGRLPSEGLVDDLLSLDIAVPSDFMKLQGRFDAAIHVAALSEGTPGDLMMATGLSAFHLLQRARELQISTIVHVSSMAVYGLVRVPVVDTQTPINHSTAYGAAKWAAECFLSAGPPHTRCISVRAPAIVGYRSHRNFLARVYSQMSRGAEEIRVSNPNHLFNNVIHEDILANFLVKLADSAPDNFVAIPVSSSEPMNLSDLISQLATQTNFKGKIVWSLNEEKPFSINSNEALLLGLSNLSTQETLNLWFKNLN